MGAPLAAHRRCSPCRCSPAPRPSAARRRERLRGEARALQSVGASRLNAHLAASTLRLQRRGGPVRSAAARRECLERARRESARERATHPARCSASSALVSATQFTSQALHAGRGARASASARHTVRRATRGGVGARGVAAPASRPAAGPTARTAVARAPAHRWRSTSSAQSAARSSATRCSAASAPSNACAMRATDSCTAGFASLGRPLGPPASSRARDGARACTAVDGRGPRRNGAWSRERGALLRKSRNF